MKIKGLLVPVNKQAALVTSQTQVTDDEAIRQEREAAAARCHQVQMEIQSLPKRHRYRKDLIEELEKLKSFLSKANKKIKKAKVVGDGLDPFIIKVCRTYINKHEWRRVIAKAKILFDEQAAKFD